MAASLFTILALSACAAARRAEAQEREPVGEEQVLLPTRWPINDEDPSLTLPTPEERNRFPLEFGYFLQELTYRADRAHEAGEHERAARYYRAISAVSPRSAVPLSLLCESYEALGRVPEALSACGLALSRRRVKIEDFARYARLALSPGAPPLDGEALEAFRSVIEHLIGAGGEAAVLGWRSRCELSIRTHDYPALDECVQSLRQLAPLDVATVSYDWALAMGERRFSEAEMLVERARQLGAPAETLDPMKSAMARVETVRTTRQTFDWWKALKILGVLVGMGLLGFATLRWNRDIRTQAS